MFLILIVIIYNVITSAKSELPVLEFEILEGPICYSKPITVLEDKPLLISVKHNNINQVNQIRCTSAVEEKHVFTVFNQKSHNTFKNAIVGPYLGQEWICELYQANGNIILCPVDAQYSTSIPTPFITINGEMWPVENSPTYPSYRLGYYNFEEGETINVECGAKPSGAVQITYSSKAPLISSEYLNDRVNMLLKLSKEDRESFVNCYIYNSFNIRLFFIHTPNPEDIILQINNVIVRPSPNRTRVYKHMFHEGELTRIECISRYDDTVMELDHFGNYQSYKTTMLQYDIILNRDHINSKLKCTAMDKATMSNAIDAIEIEFVLDFNDFFVTGLNDAILQQYQNTATTSVINYMYTDNQYLELNCTSLFSQAFPLQTVLQYTVNGRLVNDVVTIKADTGVTIYKTFALNSNYNNTVIQCSRDFNTNVANIIIKLLYKTTEMISDNGNKGNENNENENKGNESNGNENNGNENKGNANNENNGNENNGNETKGNKNIGNENNGNENKDHEKEGSEMNADENEGLFNKHWILFTACVGILMLIAVTICIAFRLRNQRIEIQTCDPTYANLIKDKEPREKKQGSESNYQNISAINSNVEEPCHYAEVINNNITKPKMPVYAQIVKKKDLNKSEYENIGHGARYVNSEPQNEELDQVRYCEVMFGPK